MILWDGYEPHGHQRRAHECGARNVQLLCGRQSGKTLWASQEVPLRIYGAGGDLARSMGKLYSPGAVSPRGSGWWKRVPRLHYWVAAETHDLLDEAERKLRLSIPYELLEHEDANSRSWWLKPDILLEFRTAKDPKRLVGPGLDGVWLEEAARMRADAWTGFMRPLVLRKKGWAISTTTPLGMDWTYEAFSKHAEENRPGYAEFTWTSEDNPYNDPKDIEEARQTLPPEYFEREYKASRQAFSGQIYTRWKADYEVEALPQGIQFTRTLAGVDWGTTNPGAIVCVGLDRHDVAWVFDEVYDRNELVEEFWVERALELNTKHRFNEYVADPAEPDNLIRFSKRGLRVTRHRNYGSGKFDEHARSVRQGIRLVASLIHQGRLRIVRGKCPNTLRELRNYRWATTPGGQQLEHPAPHQSDHAISAMRYALSYSLQSASLRAIT